SFFFVDRKTFVLGDVAYPGEQIASPRCRIAAGRKRGVVGVARVGPTEFRGNAGEPHVELPRGAVAKRGTRASALRQRPRPGGDVVDRAAILDRLPRRLGAKQCEDRGDRGRVAKAAKDARYARKGDRRKEIL